MRPVVGLEMSSPLHYSVSIGIFTDHQVIIDCRYCDESLVVLF